MKDNEEVSRIALRRVFDIALIEFGTKGYELTNINDIAKRAGVDKDFISDHFKSKYDLFVDVLKDIAAHYLFGDKHYISVEDFFRRSVRRF